MMPVKLFHGPNARTQAVAEATRIGAMLSDPIGDQGLSIDESRQIVALSFQSGVGDKPPSLVVGPLDNTKSIAAMDALLKTLEELYNKPLKLVLWAESLAGVLPTIRSRTLAVWCPPGKNFRESYEHKTPVAKALVAAIISRDAAKILGALEEEGKDWLDLSLALTRELAKVEDPAEWAVIAEVWPALREALDGRGSLIVLIDALLPPPV